MTDLELTLITALGISLIGNVAQWERCALLRSWWDALGKKATTPGTKIQPAKKRPELEDFDVFRKWEEERDG